MSENHDDFITVYRPIAGWKPVHYWWNDEEPDLGGFWEPYQTYHMAFATKEQAVKAAKAWAEDEGVRFLDDTK